MTKRLADNRIFAWSLLPAVLALAWPTMLEQLLHTAVQYIDTAMVGSLGTQATAAVGATGTVNWMIGSVVSAVGVGFLNSALTLPKPWKSFADLYESMGLPEDQIDYLRGRRADYDSI